MKIEPNQQNFVYFDLKPDFKKQHLSWSTVFVLIRQVQNVILSSLPKH